MEGNREFLLKFDGEHLLTSRKIYKKENLDKLDKKLVFLNRIGNNKSSLRYINIPYIKR